MSDDSQEIEILKDDIRTLKHVVITMMCWIVGSSNSPLRVDEVMALQEMLKEIK
jgi:hypothetical protein